METLKKTALYERHVDHGGKMVDFAGWSMPIQYGSIVEEHMATRNAVGLFDVSHMGRLEFQGEGSLAFLDGLVTRRVADMDEGQIKYGLVTNEQGGILDDVLVYRFVDAIRNVYASMVVNASNRDKILRWIADHDPESRGVSVADRTESSCMMAVQGPKAIDLVNTIVDIDAAALKYYRGGGARFGDTALFVSRTGYTGEDGCELIVGAEHAGDLWERLLAAGASLGIRAAGLAARDTLRLEAAMPLYGHELGEDINPYQAGLGFAVNLKNRDFVGRSALVAARKDTNQVKRVGLVMDGRRAAREGYSIYAGDEQVGQVTSGTFSPTLDRPIAMGYVQPSFAATGTMLEVDLRGKRLSAEVVELPFYDRDR